LPDLFFRAWIVDRPYDGAKWEIIVTWVRFLNETSANNCPIYQNVALGQSGCFARCTPGFFPDRMRSGRDSLLRLLLFRRGCSLCFPFRHLLRRFFAFFLPKSHPGWQTIFALRYTCATQTLCEADAAMFQLLTKDR
jgi:hypothetical protein